MCFMVQLMFVKYNYKTSKNISQEGQDTQNIIKSQIKQILEF